MNFTTNKYGYVHWGYLFYLLDKETHKYAIDKIGECLTANVNIYYHKPVLPSDVDNIKLEFKAIFKTSSTILIQTSLLIKSDLHITAMFTFVKIKNDKN